jgi:hypothetical protein
MVRLLEKIKRLRFRSLDRGALTDAPERPLENTDAWAAASGGVRDGAGHGGHNSIPPNYVKAYDEGRPRH